MTTPRYSGTKAHQSKAGTGTNSHAFVSPISLGIVPHDGVFFTYVYLDESRPAKEVMLQVRDGQGTWNHRAYWGANIIGYGKNNTASRQPMGALPAKGRWYRLEVPASSIGMNGKALHGFGFTVRGGVATFDSTGMTGSSVRGLMAEAPVISAANPVSKARVDLQWRTTSVADAYDVFRWEGSSKIPVRLVRTRNAKFTDKRVKAKKRYSYAIVSLKGGLPSTLSRRVQVTAK